MYIGQNFRLTLTGGIDITGGTAKIQYKDSSAAMAEKDATVSTPATAVCYADFSGTDIPNLGKWRFWLKVIVGDKTYYGKPYTIEVKALGSL